MARPIRSATRRLADDVEVRDLQATMLAADGDRPPNGLIFPFQGLDQKLTGVKPARVIDSIIA